MFDSLQNAICQKLDHLPQPDDFPIESMQPFCFAAGHIIQICKGWHGSSVPKVILQTSSLALSPLTHDQ